MQHADTPLYLTNHDNQSNKTATLPYMLDAGQRVLYSQTPGSHDKNLVDTNNSNFIFRLIYSLIKTDKIQTNLFTGIQHIQGGPKKPHKVNDTIILQPYVIESCGFQQNVPKEISYVTKVSI